MLRVGFAGLLVSFALAAAASAAAPAGFYEAKRLEPAASFVAGKPITVWCASTQYDWQQFLTAAGHTGRTVNGVTVPGSDEVRVAPVVCSNLVAKLRGKTVVTSSFAPSLLVLTHESIHARGSVDEGATDCAAVHEMPRLAGKFFRVKSGKPLRSVMSAAWAYRGTEPAAYRTAC